MEDRDLFRGESHVHGVVLAEGQVRHDALQPIEDARLQRGEGPVEGRPQGLDVLGLGVPVRGIFLLPQLDHREGLPEEARIIGHPPAVRTRSGGEQPPVRHRQAMAGRGGIQQAVHLRVLLIGSAREPFFPLGAELEPGLRPLGDILHQLEGPGPAERLGQPPFVGPSQQLQNPRRQRFHRRPEAVDLLLEQGTVLTHPRRLARHLEEQGPQVVGDQALVGPHLRGMVASHQRWPFARPAGVDQALIDVGEEAHHDLERLGMQVLEQHQAGDQLVHDRADLFGIAPRDPARQLGQGQWALRRLDHLQDPVHQGVFQRPGDPTGPSEVADITLEGQVEPIEVLDPGLAQHLEDDPREHLGEEDVIDILHQFARLVGGQEVQPSDRADARGEVVDGAGGDDATRGGPGLRLQDRGEPGGGQLVQDGRRDPARRDAVRRGMIVLVLGRPLDLGEEGGPRLR